MNKNEMRKLVKRSYKDLTPEYKAYADKKILENILSLSECNEADTVFCFVGTEIEINTIPILEKLISMGKTVCVPLCTGDGIMEARKISSIRELSPGTMNILEPPEDSTKIESIDIDFSIVPCMTCNRRGHRLGYGGGYYDRFFEGLTNPAAIICREETMFTAVPNDANDVIFDIVVTERKIYYNNRN